MYALRWVGGNEQPDIFTTFSVARIPPKGPNRGRYRNPGMDKLLEDASRSTDQERRRADYVQVQQILARDLPAFNLWYQDAVVVRSRRLSRVALSPSGSFQFLETAQWQP
jgi:peptide/nickel transport system substrate-binding protein